MNRRKALPHLAAALPFAACLRATAAVERYAYFEPGAGKDHSLFKADGSLTRMGELYRDTGA